MSNGELTLEKLDALDLAAQRAMSHDWPTNLASLEMQDMRTTQVWLLPHHLDLLSKLGRVTETVARLISLARVGLAAINTDALNSLHIPSALFRATEKRDRWMWQLPCWTKQLPEKAGRYWVRCGSEFREPTVDMVELGHKTDGNLFVIGYVPSDIRGFVHAHHVLEWQPARPVEAYDGP